MKGIAKTPNELLRRAREIRGWSQRKVAEELGITEDKVSRWERGDRKPSPYYREKLCALFKSNAEDLGFIQKIENQPQGNNIPDKDTPTIKLVKDNPLCNNSLEGINSISNVDKSFISKNAESDPAMDKAKRDSIKKISTAVGAAFLIPTQNSTQSSSPPLWERLARTLEKSSQIDENSLKGLGEVTKNYWQLRISIGYRNLLNAFTGHLETIQQLLQAPQTELNYKHLCAIASEASQRIGAIYFDMNDYVNARAYYQVSLKAASEAKNSTLYAVGLGRMSSLPIYADNPRDSLPLLKEAQRIAQKHDLRVILAWLASIEAEAFANLQLSHECLNALNRAEIAILNARTEDTNEIKFDYARLVGYKGTCLLRLRQPKDALKVLNEIQSLPGSLSPRQESIITTDIAEAYLQQGEIEIACNYAIKAIEMVDITKSNLVVQRLQKIKENMSQWEHLEPVNDFHERIVLRTLLI